jgi:hypothetical protein
MIWGVKDPRNIYERNLNEASVITVGPAGIRSEYILNEIQSYNYWVSLRYGTAWLNLGAFPKLRRASISFAMSARPSVRMERLDSDLAHFNYILSSSFFFFRKPVQKIHVSLKFKNNGYFTWRRFYIYDNISLNSF